MHCSFLTSLLRVLNEALSARRSNLLLVEISETIIVQIQFIILACELLELTARQFWPVDMVDVSVQIVDKTLIFACF